MTGGPSAYPYPPKQTISGEVVANLVYDMTTPGEYQVVVGCRFGEDRLFKTVHHAHSRVIKVRVEGLVVPDDARYAVRGAISPQKP